MIDVRGYRVEARQAGQRLDLFLARQVQDLALSRNQVQNLVKEGRVKVDGVERPAHWALRAGQAVSLVLPEPRQLKLEAQDIPLDVLFEDSELIVLNKQAGLVTHPAPGNADGTLVNALLHHLGEGLKPIHGAGRPGIVHRLDKDTTGCLVAAKSEAAFESLTRQIQDRGCRRTYLALVWGAPEADEGVVDMPIGRDPRQRQRMAVVPEGGREGRPARTRFWVRERFAGAALVELSLETGRTHQIRVHMTALKHPLLGDATYGHCPYPGHHPLVRALKGRLKRQMLHAWKLAFRHPVDGRPMEFEAPLPGDFGDALTAARALSAGSHHPGG